MASSNDNLFVTILFCSQSESPEPWCIACTRAFPKMAFRVWPDTGPREAIRYALVWKHSPGSLARLPNLKAILVLGADDRLRSRGAGRRKHQEAGARGAATGRRK
jgi:hypothetical protein